MKKYQEIFNDLKEKIITNIYHEEQLLPTEKDLCDYYQASRDTVRKALTLLTEQGFIQKIQGRGSIVIKHNQVNFPISGLTSYEELTQALHLNTKTNLVELTLLTVDETLAQQTGFLENERVWKIIRTRTIDGEVVVIDSDYLSQQFVPEITKEIAEESIYRYLENDLKLAISYAHKEITVVPIQSKERDLMKIKDDFLVLIKSQVYLNTAEQFQYTESKHKMDKFKFVDFARRKHSL